MKLPIVLLLITITRSYRIKYNDCRRPDKIFKYQTGSLCEENKDEAKPNQLMTVLQKIKSKKLKGHSCQIVTTRWKYYCGVYAHAKIASIPEVEINQGVSPTTCADMINSQKFISKDQQSWKLEMNAEKVIRVTERGQINHKDDQVQCKGQPTKIGNDIIDNIVVIAHIKVTIKEEDFVLSGLNMEVVSDHLILDCKPTSGGCRSVGGKTYIWTKEKDDCPIRKVRNLQVTEENDYWVDEVNSVVLKKLGTVAAPNGCASVILHATEYPDVFLTENSAQFLPLGDEMHVANYIAARDDFILFEAERKINRLERKFQKSLCNQQFTGQQNEGEIIRIDERNNFALQSGETTYVFTCREVEDKIRETPKCYVDIPIGQDQFVTPVTRVLTQNSREKPCNHHFPTTVKAEQSWLELRPGGPTPIAEPSPMPLDEQHENKHLDVSTGGLYTPTEVKSWEEHLESSAFHRNVLHQITNGVWTNSRGDIEEPGYTLENLRLPSPLNWFESLKKELEQYTALLCALVLAIESIKFMTTIVMLSMATMRQGIAGLIAVLTMLICPAQQTLAKMRRRAKKQTFAQNQQNLIQNLDNVMADQEC